MNKVNRHAANVNLALELENVVVWNIALFFLEIHESICRAVVVCEYRTCEGRGLGEEFLLKRSETDHRLNPWLLQRSGGGEPMAATTAAMAQLVNNAFRELSRAVVRTKGDVQAQASYMGAARKTLAAWQLGWLVARLSERSRNSRSGQAEPGRRTQRWRKVCFAAYGWAADMQSFARRSMACVWDPRTRGVGSSSNFQL